MKTAAKKLLTRETSTLDAHKAIEEFGTWNDVSFQTEKLLSGQPRGVEITYRVTASNNMETARPWILSASCCKRRAIELQSIFANADKEKRTCGNRHCGSKPDTGPSRF